ncbi:MAG TPA: invasin domain 3-containing protein [Chthonomonadaceae bacterium]|nr:invasin domain 3-containing protein [Chthonomonadaceae bacterium]
MRSPAVSIIASLLLLLAAASVGRAAGLMTVNLRATRSVLLADGKQTTTLRAEVRDSAGHFATENTLVTFNTNLGTLSAAQAPTHGGVATVTLNSAVKGNALITAFTGGGVSSPLTVVFTDDPEATFQGNNYMQFTASSYLAYSATDKVIEALGKNGGARVVYRNIEITADRMQMTCSDLILRARDNITIKRAGKTYKATRLYYSLQSGDGYAIGELNGRLQPLQIAGEVPHVEPSKTPIPTSYMGMPDLQVKLNIVAKSINYIPGDRLQFRRARFFQDQQQILVLPYYETGLNATELFTDQFISVGTNGFGLNLPFYYNLSPRGDGIIYLRHQQPLGRGYYSTQPGWAIDVIQGYSSLGDHRFEGSYGFTDLTRSDWSFRFNHNQEFNSRTQGSFDLEFPQHDSIFSAANFSHQLNAFRVGADFSGGQTFVGDHTTTSNANLFVESVPHPFFGSKGYQYTFGTNYTTGETHTTLAGVQNYNQTSENATMRVFGRPVLLDKRTTFNNSFTVGHTWSDTGGTGLTALATLSLDRTLPGGGGLNMSYDFVERPRSIFTSSGKHRVGLTFTTQSKKRFQAFLFGSAYLDAPEQSLLADFSYRLDSRWRFIGAATLQRFEDQTYNDIELIVGRRIGAREIQLGYSTFTKRVSFDFTATRF